MDKESTTSSGLNPSDLFFGFSSAVLRGLAASVDVARASVPGDRAEKIAVVADATAIALNAAREVQVGGACWTSGGEARELIFNLFRTCSCVNPASRAGFLPALLNVSEVLVAGAKQIGGPQEDVQQIIASTLLDSVLVDKQHYKRFEALLLSSGHIEGLAALVVGASEQDDGETIITRLVELAVRPFALDWTAISDNLLSSEVSRGSCAQFPRRGGGHGAWQTRERRSQVGLLTLILPTHPVQRLRPVCAWPRPRASRALLAESPFPRWLGWASCR